ncbi:hypothetical protein J6590_080044 [Homalodisca vitripennis]|nr:hypothetical protein J6590_080044 [Homalodisca vitripennis]
MFGLESLNRRRQVLAQVYLWGLVRGRVDDANCLGVLSYRVPNFISRNKCNRTPSVTIVHDRREFQGYCVGSLFGAYNFRGARTYLAEIIEYQYGLYHQLTEEDRRREQF